MDAKKEIKYKTFSEMFDDWLSPNGKFFIYKRDHIFRGENSDKNLLLPTALREDNKKKSFKTHFWTLTPNLSVKNIGKETEAMQVQAEYDLIKDFFDVSNVNGLKVPVTDILRKKQDFDSILISNESIDWIPEELEDIIALAQHYGVPTRMLDWTYNFNIALYFSCISGLRELNRNINSNKRIAIWTLNKGFLDHYINDSSPLPLRFVTPYYENNPNINAQKGVLTYWKISVKSSIHYSNIGKKDKSVNRQPLDELLISEFSDKLDDRQNQSLMYKLSLPVIECISIFGYLIQNNITASKLFPGYNGVEIELRERALFTEVGLKHRYNNKKEDITVK